MAAPSRQQDLSLLCLLFFFCVFFEEAWDCVADSERDNGQRRLLGELTPFLIQRREKDFIQAEAENSQQRRQYENAPEALFPCCRRFFRDDRSFFFQNCRALFRRGPLNADVEGHVFRQQRKIDGGRKIFRRFIQIRCQ